MLGLPIVPTRNWNEIWLKKMSFRLHPPNRTYKELKLTQDERGEIERISPNRTYKELKLVKGNYIVCGLLFSQSYLQGIEINHICVELWCASAPNRTYKELKSPAITVMYALPAAPNRTYKELKLYNGA